MYASLLILALSATVDGNQTAAQLDASVDAKPAVSASATDERTSSGGGIMALVLAGRPGTAIFLGGRGFATADNGYRLGGMGGAPLFNDGYDGGIGGLYAAKELVLGSVRLTPGVTAGGGSMTIGKTERNWFVMPQVDLDLAVSESNVLSVVVAAPIFIGETTKVLGTAGIALTFGG